MDHYAQQKAYAAQAQAMGMAQAAMGQIGNHNDSAACRETEINALCNRLANLIGRSENTALHLGDVCDRLLGASVQASNTAQGGSPRPVPNGIVQAISMGLDALEVNLDRAQNAASRLSNAI